MVFRHQRARASGLRVPQAIVLVRLDRDWIRVFFTFWDTRVHLSLHMLLEDHPRAFLASLSRYWLSICTLPVVRLDYVLLVAESFLPCDELLEV